MRESQRTDALRRINVHQNWQNNAAAENVKIDVPGKMSEDKRKRIRKVLATQPEYAAGEKRHLLLTRETLQQLAALDHVQRVEPTVNLWESVHLKDQSFQVAIESAAPQDRTYLRRIVSGRFFESPDEPSAVVSEILLYRSGIIDDEAVEAMLGQKLRLEIQTAERPQAESLRIYLYRPQRNITSSIETELIARLNRQLPAQP